MLTMYVMYMEWSPRIAKEFEFICECESVVSMEPNTKHFYEPNNEPRIESASDTSSPSTLCHLHDVPESSFAHELRGPSRIALRPIRLPKKECRDI